MSKKTKLKDFKAIIHYIPDASNAPSGIDAHTHGLNEIGLPEFQCVCPFSPEDMNYILNMLMYEIKIGNVIIEGVRSDFLSDGYRMAFIPVQDPWEEGKTQLRVLYPDENNLLPWEKGCDAEYARQICDIPEEDVIAFLKRNS